MKILIFVSFLCFSSFSFSQKTVSSNESSITQRHDNYYIGLDTGESDNFYDILTTLKETTGIQVLSYCELNHIIKISFDKKYFRELKTIFIFIEKNFSTTTCYDKNYSENNFQDMCFEELVKRNNLGGKE